MMLMMMRRVELVFIDRSIDPAALILFADKSKRYLSTSVLYCVGGCVCSGSSIRFGDGQRNTFHRGQIIRGRKK